MTSTSTRAASGRSPPRPRRVAQVHVRRESRRTVIHASANRSASATSGRAASPNDGARGRRDRLLDRPGQPADQLERHRAERRDAERDATRPAPSRSTPRPGARRRRARHGIDGRHERGQRERRGQQRQRPRRQHVATDRRGRGGASPRSRGESNASTVAKPARPKRVRRSRRSRQRVGARRRAAARRARSA